MKLREKVAVIGVGNMGEALIRGFLERGVIGSEQLVGAEKFPARAQEIAARYGIQIHESPRTACAGADVIVLAVKPQDVDPTLADITAAIDRGLLVSVCAGVTLEQLTRGLPAGLQVVRVMPNTPALVGAGASAYCGAPGLDDAARTTVEALLGAVGTVHAVAREDLLDAVTGLSGSGPAYVFTFLEALADAGVLMGLPRQLARDLANQTVLGAAQLARDGDEHPAELRDRVTSPGGTTAAGLRQLELRGWRAAILEAVRAASLRSRELGG